MEPEPRAPAATVPRRKGFRFSLSTLLLATILIGGLMGVWRLRSPWVLEHELTDIRGISRFACFSVNGEKLLTEGPRARHLSVWDMGSGVQLDVIKAATDCISNRGCAIKTGMDQAREIYDVLWEEYDPNRIDAYYGSHYMVIERQSDGTARLWNTGAAANHPWLSIRTCSGIGGLSPDGTCFVDFSIDTPRAVILQADMGYEEYIALEGVASVMTEGSYTPDGRQIIAGYKDGTIATWDATNGELLDLFQAHDGEITDLVLFPDGVRVLTAGRDGTARIWNIEAGTEELLLKGHRGKVWSAQYRVDRRRLVTAGDDGTVRVWDAVTGESVRVFSTGGKPAWRAFFSPNGTRVVAICDDQRILVWRQLRTEGWAGLFQRPESWVVCATALLLVLIGLRNLYHKLRSAFAAKYQASSQ